MKKDKIFFNLMFVVLIGIGVLQFFELPKIVDYILGVVAICFGIIGYILKFRKK